MLDTTDLMHFNRWCAQRRLQWQPGRTEHGEPAILLQKRLGRSPWGAMLLVEDEDGLGLMSGDGDLLATASDLPALLDALDAGVASEAISRPAAAYAGRSSTFWNNAGSAIT